jgi:hypothetical protein
MHVRVSIHGMHECTVMSNLLPLLSRYSVHIAASSNSHVKYSTPSPGPQPSHHFLNLLATFTNARCLVKSRPKPACRLFRNPHQRTLRLAGWPILQIKEQVRILEEPVGALMYKFASIYQSKRSTYHSGRIPVTVRINGLVVTTNSLKITHSGCVSSLHDGCSSTAYHDENFH